MAFGVFQFRRGTAAQWTSANTVLAAGELGLETDTQKFKIGNGTTAWNSLPYGGIKGDTGATGAAGVSPTVAVGATTVVTPATNPSVTDADAGANADLRFSLPRARAVAAGTTTTGAAGTSANVTSATDGNGDVSLNFTIPRGDTGATGATGPTGPAANAFTNVAVSGQTTVAAEVANDTLTLVAGTGITLTTDAAADSVTITGTVSAPQNTFANVSVGTTPTPTVLQADLAADTVTINAGTGIVLTADAATDTMSIANSGVTSVNGQSGAVTIPVATTVTRTAATASASTVLTTIQSYPVATGEIVAGSEYEFYASLRVINTITATNAVVTLSVGATNVLVLTQAIGATAAAAPGAAVELYGRITFYSATAAEAYIRASKQAAVAFDAVANTSASITVAAAAATTIDLKFNTSGATSTFIARQATIRRVK